MERLLFSMKFIRIKAWPIWLALLAMVSFCAEPAALRIEALALPYDSSASPWQRAEPALENEALLLELPHAGLQLALLRHTRRLKTDAPTYFDRLGRNWRARHGQDVHIGWLESGGQKWLYCQHASQERDGKVWQLSSVFDGRAYSVLVFGPDTAASDAHEIPAAARELIAGARFAVDAPGRPDSSHAKVASAPYWVKTRTLFPHTNADVLEALVQGDIARLGQDGLLSGYGLDFGASGASWFVEGYAWKTRDARVEKVALDSSGRLAFELPAETTGTAKARVQLSLNDNEADIGVQLRVWQLCAPGGHIAETLRQLQQGARLSLRRLAQSPAAGCPPSDGVADWAHVLQGESGRTVSAEVALVLPPALSGKQLAEMEGIGQQYLLLVEIAAYTRPNRTGFGDQLIERARGYVMFQPGQAAKD